MEPDKQTLDRQQLEALPTETLDGMLRTELQKHEPDGPLCRLLLQILEERDRQERDPDAGGGNPPAGRKKRIRGRFLQIAAGLLVFCGVVFALPKAASADNFFQMISKWSNQILELFNSEDARGTQVEYVFRTEHPGLQQVHDAAAELGVTGPGVPMWMPEDYELTEFKKIPSPTKTRLHTRFKGGEAAATFTIDVYSADMSYTYQKDETQYTEYEYNGLTHYIMKNEGTWTAVWQQNNIVYTIIIECREDVLYRIIDSIYTSEA